MSILFSVYDSDHCIAKELEYDADIIKAVKKAVNTTGCAKVIAHNLINSKSSVSKITQSKDIVAIRTTIDHLRFSSCQNIGV